MEDESSEFMRFIKSTCLHKDSPVQSGDDMRLDSFMMRAIGVLWCEGHPSEKVVELYDNMQDNN